MAETSEDVAADPAGSQDEPEELPWKRLPAPETWEQFETGIKAWVESHWTEGENRRCGHCNESVWVVGEVVSLSTTPGWPLAPGSAPGIYPMAQVVCAPCGAVVLVNALWVFEGRQP